MLKTEIADQVAKEARLTKKAAHEAVDSVFGEVAKALARGEKVVFSGFGTFVIRTRRARHGRNPKTGSSMQLPSMKTVGFIASKSLKKVIK
jgi:nucleoid DNA-binding protein